MAYVQQERSLGELFNDLSQETSKLIRQEVQLAKTEMSEKAQDAGRNAAMLAAGAFVAYGGFLALLYAAILGLGEFIGDGWAALIVGLIVAGAGYFMLQKGLSELKQVDPVPQRTLRTLQEDEQWIKQQVQ